MPRKKQKIQEKITYPITKEEKLSRLKILARNQNKKAGEVVIKFGTDLEVTTKTSIGVPEIDNLLGGGIPDGRIITVWGDKGCGKTTMALAYISELQKHGKVVYYVALEKLDKERAIELGVNLEELVIGEFPIAESCLDSIIEMAKQRLVDVIVVDSIHSLSPEGEQQDKKGKEKSTKDDTMALLARKLSQFFRMANHYLKTGNITLFLIGQTRTSLGFIALETLSGGNALKHYSKLIIHMRHGQKKNAPKEYRIDENGDGETVQIGFECVCKIDKTQISGTKNEGTETRFPFYYEGGFIKREKIINAKNDIIKSNGFNDKEPELIESDKIEEVDIKSILKHNKGRFKKEYNKLSEKMDKGLNLPKEIIEKKTEEQIKKKLDCNNKEVCNKCGFTYLIEKDGTKRCACNKNDDLEEQPKKKKSRGRPRKEK